MGVTKENTNMFHLLRAAGAFFLVSSMLFVSYHLIIDYAPSPYFVRKPEVVIKSDGWFRFKYFACSPLPREIIQFDEHIFQVGQKTTT